MAEVKKKEAPIDHYAALGVEKTASAQEITVAYRKLALKWHPDRNRGEKQEMATEKFKAVSEAYAVVGDVTKRRQYDLHGTSEEGSKMDMEAVEVENVGWVGRFLAAQVAKFGIPIPTTVSPDVLGKAKDLAAAESTAQTTGGGRVEGDGCRTMPAGVVVEGKLAITSAEFFTLDITAEMALNGVVIAAKTKRKNDRFRVLVFDSRGDVRYQAEASPSLEGSSGGGSNSAAAKSIARCRLFLAPYNTLSVGAPFPSLDDTPPICHSLDTLEERGPCALSAGTHLCAIYNDNFLSSIDYTVALVPLEASDENQDGARDRVQHMEEVATKLKDKQQSLNNLAEAIVNRREALAKAQEAYKASLEEAKSEEAVVASLLRTLAECQQVSVAMSHAKATGSPLPMPPTRRSSSAAADGGGGGGGNLSAVEDALDQDDDDASSQASGGLRGSKIGNFFGRLTSRNNVGENEKRANVL